MCFPLTTQAGGSSAGTGAGQLQKPDKVEVFVVAKASNLELRTSSNYIEATNIQNQSSQSFVQDVSADQTFKVPGMLECEGGAWPKERVRNWLNCLDHRVSWSKH